MKITKIKTAYGEFQSYESSDFEAIVEQMRSDNTKEAASRVAAARTKDCFWQVQTIQKELANHLKSCDVPNLKVLGETLKKLRWPRGGISGIRGYYLKLK